MKDKTKFTCTNCHYESPKWLGKCPNCGEWSTFEEQTVIVPNKRDVPAGKVLSSGRLQEQETAFQRILTRIGEVDLVFGGGIVQGSIALLSGEPGIGKSTLTLQICDAFLRQDKTVLYAAGEESAAQIAHRAKRLGVAMNLAVVNDTVLEDIIETAKHEQPDLLIVDSIQVVYSNAITGVPGSVNQVRFAAEKLMELAKGAGITVLLIGHVTKDGTLAGPRVLEHLVDCVLYLEGERYQNLRLLKTFKNRFGPTDEVGVLEMEEKGLVEVKNPNLFFTEEGEGRVGSILTCVLEGSRPFFIEVQALVTYTKFGYPKRTTSGIDLNRLNIILAVLSKYTSVNLDSYDVYVSTVGGITARDPAVDLAVALAIASSRLQKNIPAQTLALGEIGLTGSIRPVFQIEKRLKEARKLGIEEIILAPMKGKVENGMVVRSVKEAVERMFP